MTATPQVTSPGARPDAAAETPPASGRVVVEGLVKTYGTRLALRGADCRLDNGLIGLLGPNGAGKSTLMKCLAGIQSWDRGRITIDGIDAERHPRDLRRLVGYMPERVSFPAEMRTAAYLAYVAAAKGIARSERVGAVELALTRAGLDGVRSRIIGNLSKGFRQRVGLAQALLGDPVVVILDEPTAGLDPLNLLDIRAVLSDYAVDHVVLLSTHTLPEARLLCDRLLVLAQGAIVYDGPTVELTLSGAEARRIRVRAQGGDEQGLAAIVAEAGGRVVKAAARPGACDAVVELQGEGAVAALNRSLVLAGWSVEAIEPLSDVLEDAFRQAVQAEPDQGKPQ
ncbi:MAG TPA: ABC transporter ATP-binding protein [Acidimicrobiia bacterium]|jgi:ABC-2 type transport system ATP-binding protein|nr:ABC transporter ATP-binding protein [Acidimicrobiia bacterium]